MQRHVIASTLTGYLLVLGAAAVAQDVTLTTEEKNVGACTYLETVTDNEVGDLRKKIVRAGGDTGLISFTSGDGIIARAYRCMAAGGSSSSPAPSATAPPAPPAAPQQPLVLPPIPAAGAVSGNILVVQDANVVRGCRILGTVADNDLEDLQKKAARLGGNVALLTPQRRTKGGYFGLQDYTTADVYACEAGR